MESWGVTMSLPAGISGKSRIELAEVFASGKRFISPSNVVDALGVEPRIAAAKLSQWARAGWVRRVRRGLYIGVPVDTRVPFSWSEDPLQVASVVWTPCYFTGWTAAKHWALTDQVFRTTVLKTSDRVRASHDQLLDHEYLVSHTNEANMEWGLKSEWSDEFRLLFADPARTVVDILDNPSIGGGVRHSAEILSAYLDNHDPKTLVQYADRLGNRTIFKRLGYLTEVLGRELPDLVAACRERLSAGISLLDPDGRRDGPRLMKWGIQVNASIAKEEPS